MSDLSTHDARCGLCGFTFEAQVPRARASVLRWRDSDRCPWYEGPNPVFYAAWVCPSCHYAGYREDFSGSPGKHRDAIQEALAAGSPSALAVAFDGTERSLFAALSSYQLALICYEARKAGPEVLAGLALQAAWICRYAGELRREIGFLAKARDLYLEAFERGARRDARLGDLAIAFLIGETQLRTGRIGEAWQYFRVVAEAPEARAGRAPGERESRTRAGTTACDTRSAVLAALARERQDDALRAQRVREFLEGIPMFVPLGERGLSLLAVHGAEQTFKPGAAITVRGAPGDAMYAIVSGEVRLYRAEGEAIATLGHGETFGEMALFTGGAHPETAVALAPFRGGDKVVVLEIGRTVFRNLVKAVPDVALRVAVAMSQRYARAAEAFQTV